MKKTDSTVERTYKPLTNNEIKGMALMQLVTFIKTAEAKGNLPYQTDDTLSFNDKELFKKAVDDILHFGFMKEILENLKTVQIEGNIN